MLDEDVTTLGEDYALYNKLAESDYEFAIINLKEKHIGEPKTLVDVFKKNYNYGLQMKDFLNQTGTNKGLKQFLPFGRKYMINMFTDSFSKDIKLSMGLILYISIVYTSTGIGMLNRIIQGKNEK